jgi:ethanolamine kinase
MAKQVTSDKGRVAIDRIQLSYNEANSDASALELVYTVCPQWRTDPGRVKIVPFTDGIMNTVCPSIHQVASRYSILTPIP